MQALGWQFAVLFFLVLGNGLFAMAEIALISSRKARLQQWAEDGDRKARKALDLIEAPGRFLATVQVGITLVNILIGALGGATIAENLTWIFDSLPEPVRPWASLVMVVVPITYLQVVLGELLPKALALRHAESIARLAAGPMGRLSTIATPLVVFLNASTETILRVFGAKPAKSAPVTEEEIAVMLAQGTKAGVFEVSQQDMMESVIEMGDRRITSLMTAKPDITWLDADAAAEDIEAVLASSPYSRFPVCKGSSDHVLGVVHSKDILARYLTNQPMDLKVLAKPIPTVPDSIPVLKALDAFRASGETMALISDEYGSLLGLVTLQDVLQNILGDMAQKQTHPSEADVVKRPDGSWLVDGTKPTELLGVESLPGEDENSYQSLGGFVMAHLGRIPKTGDVFESGGFRYEVVDMDGRRVDKVLVKRTTEPGIGA
jgi:putative hemolysin